uniref:Uncharacterized protein n=1 Tax=Anguilla anguilla TaxID=7936 RepID=A0A0E9VIK8_ANGAN
MSTLMQHSVKAGSNTMKCIDMSRSGCF